MGDLTCFSVGKLTKKNRCFPRRANLTPTVSPNRIWRGSELYYVRNKARPISLNAEALTCSLLQTATAVLMTSSGNDNDGGAATHGGVDSGRNGSRSACVLANIEL